MKVRPTLFHQGQKRDEARTWWMEAPSGRTVVAVERGKVVGSAKMSVNRSGRGAHVATASFLVDPNHQGKGIGRALGEHVVDWVQTEGCRGIQFNAVVEVDHPAVHSWKSLGFKVIGTAPEAFGHPEAGLVGLPMLCLKFG